MIAQQQVRSAAVWWQQQSVQHDSLWSAPMVTGILDAPDQGLSVLN